MLACVCVLVCVSVGIEYMRVCVSVCEYACFGHVCVCVGLVRGGELQSWAAGGGWG